MSCKVLPPNGETPLAPVSWKRVDVQGPARAPAPPPPEREPEIARLREQYDERVREAHAAGVREGEAAGRKSAAAEFQVVVERFAQTAAELGQMRARLRREAEADTIKLAMAIARRVIRRELAVDPEAVHGLLIGALERLQSKEVTRIRVHTSHAPIVERYLRENCSGAAMEVIADASRIPGTAIFETARGNLDASVETQLEEIERGLTDRLHQRS